MGLLALFLFIGPTGTAARLFTEQLAWAFGLALTGGKNPDGYVLVLHLAAMVALGIALWLWNRGDARTPPFLRVAAVAQFAIAPLGLPIGMALWWAARRPDLQDATERMTVAGGSARIRVVLIWLASTVLTLMASVGAYLLFGLNLLLWFGAALSAALPQVAALAMLMMASPDPKKEIVPHAMPPLPDLDQR